MGGRMYDPVLGRFLSPDPYVQIAISAALGAGLQTAINGGGMEQVFIAAALGFTAGYAGSIIGADKLAHAMSGQPLFATGSAPGVLSYRVPEGGGSSLARMWPAIAANFGAKMAEGMGGKPNYRQGASGTPSIDSAAEARKNLRTAAHDVIAAMRSGKLDLGIPENEIIGGYDGITLEYQDQFQCTDCLARVAFSVDEAGRVKNVVITTGREGASSLAEAYERVGVS